MDKVPEKAVGTKKDAVPKVQEEQTMAVNPFDCLPNEILEKIMCNLDLPGITSARLTCKRFKAHTERLIRMNIPLRNDTLEDIETNNYQLNELRVVLNKLQIPHKLSAQMKRTFATASKLHFMVESQESTVFIKPYDAIQIDGKGIQVLLEACQQVKSLKFDFHFMDCYGMTSILDVSRLQFPNLSTMQITFSYISFLGVETALLRLKTPCLRNLEIEQFHVNSVSFQNTYSYLGFYIVFLECLARHKATLRSLKLVRMLTTSDDNETAVRESGFLPELAEMQLESLEIVHRVTDNRNFVGANGFLNHLSELKVFKLQTNSEHLMELATNLIIRNGHSLTTLELDIEPMASSTLDFMPTLTACTSLSLTFWQIRFGFFPLTLQDLTWNAPISIIWYDIRVRNLIPSLRTMSLGRRAMDSLALGQICFTLFGPPADRTGFTTLILLYKVVNNDDPVLAVTQQLPQEVYKVEVTEDDIRITMQ